MILCQRTQCTEQEAKHNDQERKQLSWSWWDDHRLRLRAPGYASLDPVAGRYHIRELPYDWKTQSSRIATEAHASGSSSGLWQKYLPQNPTREYNSRSACNFKPRQWCRYPVCWTISIRVVGVILKANSWPTNPKEMSVFDNAIPSTSDTPNAPNLQRSWRKRRSIIFDASITIWVLCMANSQFQQRQFKIQSPVQSSSIFHPMH